MKIEYNLSENDLLQYTLYQFKNQGLIKKTIFKELLLIMIIFSLIVIGFYLVNNITGLYITAIVFLIVLIIRPSRLKELYFKRCQKDVRKMYASKFDTKIELILKENNIHSKSTNIELIIDYAEIKYFIETSQHVFIILSSNALIIPKKQLNFKEKMIEDLKKICLTYNKEYKEDLNWNW